MTHNCLVIPSSLSDIFRLPYNPQYMYVRTYDVHIKYIVHESTTCTYTHAVCIFYQELGAVYNFSIISLL